MKKISKKIKKSIKNPKMMEKVLKIIRKMKNYKKLEKNRNNVKKKNKNYSICLEIVFRVELVETKFRKKSKIEKKS